jgi:hypothetical protein
MILLAQGKKDEARSEAEEAKRLGLEKHPIFAALGMAA